MAIRDKRVQALVESDLYDKLDRMANEESRSMSDFVRIILVKYVEDNG